MVYSLKKYTDTMLDWLLIFISLFFAFNFERLYNIGQDFFTLNYDYANSPNSDWTFLKYYADNNLLFTNYSLIYTFLIFITLFTYIYLIKNIKHEITFMRTVFLIFSGFLWFFIIFLMFTSSMEKYNFVLIPMKSINAIDAKELSILGSKLFFSYTYLKSFLDISSQLVLVSLISFIAIITLNYNNKNKTEKIVWVSLIANLFFYGYISYINHQIGNITVTGSGFAISPGLVNSHISYPIPSLLLSWETYLIYIFIIISILMVYEKEITDFRMKVNPRYRKID